MSGAFTVEKVSERCYKIVEDDQYGQYPFIYVILGVDKVIVIDTGCGGSRDKVTIRDFISRNFNSAPNPLPYLVVCTHVHFDHVGGNHLFLQGKDKGIWMGSNAENFTKNAEINSLAHARGCRLREFPVARWLKEKDLIYLDDNNPTPLLSLEVLFTPGHTPDSIALVCHWENRIFIGDSLYPFTAVHVDCLGSNLLDYVNSLKKLRGVIAEMTSGSNAPNEPAELIDTSDPQSLSPLQLDNYNSFLSIANLSPPHPFSVPSYLQSFNWDLEQAMNSYFLSSVDDLAATFPASGAKKQKLNDAADQSVFLSCGHVEANLEASAVDDMLNFLSFIKMSLIPPISIDEDGYGEYSNERFTIIISQNQLSQIPDDYPFF